MNELGGGLLERSITIQDTFGDIVRCVNADGTLFMTGLRITKDRTRFDGVPVLVSRSDMLALLKWLTEQFGGKLIYPDLN